MKNGARVYVCLRCLSNLEISVYFLSHADVVLSQHNVRDAAHIS